MIGRALVACAVVVLAGCGGHTRPAARTGSWQAVLRDWQDDGTFEEAHSCAAVIEASKHIPPDSPVYSTIVRDLAREAAQVCGDSSPALAVFRCTLSELKVSASLQGATGSQLGGVRIENPGPTCSFPARPQIMLTWHGESITPPSQPFPAGALRAVGPFRSTRVLAHGASLFVWMQWLNYCGRPLGPVQPLLVLHVPGDDATLSRRMGDVTPPYCNDRAFSRLYVSDFGATS